VENGSWGSSVPAESALMVCMAEVYASIPLAFSITDMMNYSTENNIRQQ